MPPATIPYRADGVKPLSALAAKDAGLGHRSDGGGSPSDFPGSGQRLLLAIGWTEWHHDLRLLVVAVAVGCRTIPVQAAVFSETHLPRPQNLQETIFLQLSVHTLRALEQAAMGVCDRDFRCTS